MSVFGGYATFYDTFYQTKDYGAECDFIEQLFARYAGEPIHTLLDLGCGTGGHALPLAQRGYQVTGVDRSEVMLAAARQKGEFTNVRFFQGDIRELDLGECFNAIISMFAVIGYMVSNEDLLAAFCTARRHLRSGGLFCFDTWFGPAVLADRPGDRHRIIMRDTERIVRLASSKLNILQQTVDVHYTILRLRDDHVLSEVEETHTMRFLFPQETMLLLEQAGFRVLRVCPFLRPDDEIDEREWNMAVVAEAV